MKPKNILAPLDFSSFSAHATNYALHLARKYKSKVTLFHVIVLYEADVDEEVYVQQLEEIIRHKEESSSRLLEEESEKFDVSDITIETKIKRGISAANTILEFIDESSFDLIVMGTHGRTGVKKLLYGSVAEKVVRLSPIPVLTVHKSPQQIELKKILVPIDFSENSKKGAEAAVSIAKDFDAQLEFIHVIEQQLHPSFHAVGIESILAVNPELQNISSQKLKEFYPVSDIKTKYTVLEGTAHQTISDYARDNKTDLIVMSTRGFTGLDHLLIGSTTERVIRIAPCPVLTVGRKN